MGTIYQNSILPERYKKKISTRGGSYCNNELFYSIAFQKLNLSTRNLLHCFIIQLKWIYKRKKRIYTNNGDISFTETQFKEWNLGCSYTYIKARNQLIECGFIKPTYRGGMCRGDMSKYKILSIEGVPLEEQRWKDYPSKNWKHEIPKEKDNQVGINTRFKKGKQNRKSKSTLIDHPHNDTNPPNKVDSKND